MLVRGRSTFGLFVAVALLGALIPAAPTRAAPARDIEGNTYTSPTYGVTITWDDSWTVAEENASAGLDSLVLVNGVTVAQFIASPQHADPTGCLAVLPTIVGLSLGISDLTPLVGIDGAPIRGADDREAYAAYTGAHTLDDGTVIALAVDLDCQAIVPGRSALTLVALMPVDAFGWQLPLVQGLLAGVVLPEPVSAMDAGLTTGEPAPVFVSVRWRIAVATVVRDDAIEMAGLEAKDSKDWIVVVADVTNWSDQDASFAGDDLGIFFSDDTRRYGFAPNSSRAVARALDLEIRDLKTANPIEAGATVRIALTFLVPEDREAPTLRGMISETGLPLADEQGAEALQELPPPAEPPELMPVEIVDVIDGETVELEIAGEPEVVRARLIGVAAPDADTCVHGRVSSEMDRLTEPSNSPSQAWVERDPTAASGTTWSVYLWRENALGLRVLINERQLADGYAEPRRIDGTVRFAAWILEAGRTARATERGLWGDCGRSTGSAAGMSTPATSLATNTATPAWI